MLFNPAKSSLDFNHFKKKSKIAPESEKKELKFEKFSEENFIEFKVFPSNNQSLKLHTYREHGKDLPDTTKPRALMFSAHGLHGHQNQQACLAKIFSANGITTIGFDIRGHGKSEGLRGSIRSSQDLVNDYMDFIQLIDTLYDKNIPRFLFGISMGGMLSFLIGHRIPNYFKGIIFLAPAFHMKVSNLMISFTKCLFCCCLNFKLKLPSKNDLSKNPASHEAWLADPFVYNSGIRPKTVFSLNDGGIICRRNFDQFTTPFVIAVGAMDKLVEPEACVDFYEKSPAKDKNLLFSPTMWHGVFHEEEFEEISIYLSKWVNDRISGAIVEIKFES